MRPGKNMIVVGGRFKGETFHNEGTIEEVIGPLNLPMLATTGNWAARNAIEIDRYTVKDEPFYYGHIGGLGYIISGKDLGLV